MTINKLYVNGCSWVEGYMLYMDPFVYDIIKNEGYIKDPDSLILRHRDRGDLHYSYKDVYNRFNFASHLSKNFNIDTIINDAIGAGSNDRIVRTTIDHFKNLSLEERKSTFVVIGWSFPHRSELFITDGIVSHWSLFNATQRFTDLQPNVYTPEFSRSMDKFWEMYVTTVYNYNASVKKYFQHVYMLHTILEHLEIQHYFFNSFSITYDHEFNWELHHSDVEWFNQQLNFRNIDDTFAGFIGDNRDLMIHDHHPNALGHKLWGDKLIEDIKNKGLI